MPNKLNEPFNWNVPRKVFVNSMSDLFQCGLDHVPDEYIGRVCAVMRATPWHTYQVLTKRHERMRDLLDGILRPFADLPNVWWGVSVENKKHGLPRIDALRAAPAAVRFLSAEPLLEDLGSVNLTGIHWVIAGGESGHKARPMEVAWVESLRDQCLTAGVKFFFKQWGGVQKSKTGRLLDGKTFDEMPEIPVVPVPSKRERSALAAALGEEPTNTASKILNLL